MSHFDPNSDIGGPAALDKPCFVIHHAAGLARGAMMDIGHWLRKLDLERHESAFRENKIDSEILPKLTVEDLKDLGVSLVGDRRRLLDAIGSLRPQFETAAPDAVPQAALEPEPAEAGGERRQVAVLFADLCGFTALSSRLDAEDLRRLVEEFYAQADAIIAQYGGSVDKHIGDAVMALFGAPIAHGDDALRALRAALDIQVSVAELVDPSGNPLACHVGVASGEVVAGGIGRGYTVLGDAVNLAARLVELARPGETVISEPLARLLEGKIRATMLAPATLKGITLPVIGWRVEGLEGETGSTTPFVGREADLLMLKGQLQACRDSGHGRLVVLRGEAGIGKSRLLEEISREAQRLGFATHRTLVLDFGTGKGQDPMRLLTRSFLEIPSGADKRRRIHSRPARSATYARAALRRRLDRLPARLPDGASRVAEELKRGRLSARRLT